MKDVTPFVDQPIPAPLVRLYTTITESVVNNPHVHAQLCELMHMLAKPGAICANIMIPSSIDSFDGTTCKEAEAGALRAIVRATLQVGGRVCHRSHLGTVRAMGQPFKHSVDVHTRDSLLALSYSHPGVRQRAASVSPPAFMVTVTWYATEHSALPTAPPMMLPYSCIERMTEPYDTAGGDWVHACAACVAEAPVLSVCGGCRKTRYCSRDCQAAHWHAHKTWCRSVRA